jgi:hypothetical protein
MLISLGDACSPSVSQAVRFASDENSIWRYACSLAAVHPGQGGPPVKRLRGHGIGGTFDGATPDRIEQEP